MQFVAKPYRQHSSYVIVIPKKIMEAMEMDNGGKVLVEIKKVKKK